MFRSLKAIGLCAALCAFAPATYSQNSAVSVPYSQNGPSTVAWQANIFYKQGQIVGRNSELCVSLAFNNSYDPATDTTHWACSAAPLGFTPENTNNKGQPNGYAPLDSTGKVPSANLPAGTGNSSSPGYYVATGTLPSVTPSSGVLDFISGTARILSWGSNSSTYGTYSLFLGLGDGSKASDILDCDVVNGCDFKVPVLRNGAAIGGGITLQHSGVANGSQSKLNLVPGQNVSISDDGAGNLTIASTASGGSSSSPWFGKNMCVFGDSISAIFSNIWQNNVIAASGMNSTIAFQDAVQGRSMAQIFSNYTIAAGSAAPINIFDVNARVSGAVVNATTGNLDTSVSDSGNGATGTVPNDVESTGLMDLRGAPQWTSNFSVHINPNQNTGIAYYNSSGTFLSGDFEGQVGEGGDLATGTVFTVPNGAKYVRFTFVDGVVVGEGHGGYANMMVVTGNQIPASYQPYDATSQYTLGTGGVPTDSNGHTLAQNVAGCDIMFVELGTNDGGDTIGAVGDAATAQTFYGYVRNAAERITQANPAMRVVWITPYQTDTTKFTMSAAQDAAINAAIKYQAGLFGEPVVDMLHNLQVNQYNWPSTLDGQGVHPSNSTTWAQFSALISHAIQQIN